MSDAAAYPYETRLNIEFQPLELIDEKALADACQYKWFNQTLCQVNGSVVRMGVVEGEYHWHKHDEDDEFFTWWKAGSSSTWRGGRWNWRRGRGWWCRREWCTGRGRRSGR